MKIYYRVKAINKISTLNTTLSKTYLNIRLASSTYSTNTTKLMQNMNIKHDLSYELSETHNPSVFTKLSLLYWDKKTRQSLIICDMYKKMSFATRKFNKKQSKELLLDIDTFIKPLTSQSICSYTTASYTNRNLTQNKQNYSIGNSIKPYSNINLLNTKRKGTSNAIRWSFFKKEIPNIAIGRYVSSSFFSNSYLTKTGYRLFDILVSNPHQNCSLSSSILYACSNLKSYEKWAFSVKTTSKYHLYLKLLWRYYKLRIERYFYTNMRIRAHVYFFSIWKVFFYGIGSQKSWVRFEQIKIGELTKRGSKFIINYREDAKFFLRVSALSMVMPSGLKLFIEKVATRLKTHRKHWAHIRYIMKFFRRVSNYFWFRFFINYKVSLQGKIDGDLRCRKKIYKRGSISIEDWSLAVAYCRAYPKTKVGIFNLSMWLQFRVPDIIPTFQDNMILASTMDVLLNRYSLPYIVQRLSHIISHTLKEQKIAALVRAAHDIRYNRVRMKINKNYRLNKVKNKKFYRKLYKKIKARKYAKKRIKIQKISQK